MTVEELDELRNGIYIVYFKDGSCDLAAIGDSVDGLSKWISCVGSMYPGRTQIWDSISEAQLIGRDYGTCFKILLEKFKKTKAK